MEPSPPPQQHDLCGRSSEHAKIGGGGVDGPEPKQPESGAELQENPEKNGKGWQAGSTSNQRAQGRYDRQWDDTFAFMKAYYDTHGHCDVPPAPRVRKRTGKDGEGVQVVNPEGSVGGETNGDGDGESIPAAAAQPVDDSLPKVYDDGYLHKWAERQREQYRIMQAGKKCSITPERIAKLREINFSFDPTGDKWRSMFEKLKAFKDEFGHCNPVQRKGESRETCTLAKWANAQRTIYTSYAEGRSRENALTLRPKIQLLRDLGFDFSTPRLHVATFEENLAKLRKLQAEQNEGVEPADSFLRGEEREAFLDWTKKQRLAYRAVVAENKSNYRGMTLERLAKLIDAGMDFNPVETQRKEARIWAKAAETLEQAEEEAETEAKSAKARRRVDAKSEQQIDLERERETPKRRRGCSQEKPKCQSRKRKASGTVEASEEVSKKRRKSAAKAKGGAGKKTRVRRGKKNTANPKSATSSSRGKKAASEAVTAETVVVTAVRGKKRGRVRSKKLPTQPQAPLEDAEADESSSKGIERSTGNASASNEWDVPVAAAALTATSSAAAASGRKRKNPRKLSEQAKCASAEGPTAAAANSTAKSSGRKRGRPRRLPMQHREAELKQPHPSSLVSPRTEAVTQTQQLKSSVTDKAAEDMLHSDLISALQAKGRETRSRSRETEDNAAAAGDSSSRVDVEEQEQHLKGTELEAASILAKEVQQSA